MVFVPLAKKIQSLIHRLIATLIRTTHSTLSHTLQHIPVEALVNTYIIAMLNALL